MRGVKAFFYLVIALGIGCGAGVGTTSESIADKHTYAERSPDEGYEEPKPSSLRGYNPALDGDDSGVKASEQLAASVDEARGWDDVTLKRWRNLVKYRYLRPTSGFAQHFAFIDSTVCPSGKALAIDMQAGQYRYDELYCPVSPDSTLLVGSDPADRGTKYRMVLCHCSVYESHHGRNFGDWCRGLEAAYYADDPTQPGWHGQDEDYCKDANDDGVVSEREERDLDGGMVIISLDPNYVIRETGKPFRFWHRYGYP